MEVWTIFKQELKIILKFIIQFTLNTAKYMYIFYNANLIGCFKGGWSDVIRETWGCLPHKLVDLINDSLSCLVSELSGVLDKRLASWVDKGDRR